MVTKYRDIFRSSLEEYVLKESGENIRLHRPKTLIFNNNINNPLVSVRINTYKKLGTISYGIEFDEEDSDNLTHTSITNINELPNSLLINFVHNYSFLLFSDDSDQKLSDFFPIMNDGYDNVTPDLIMKISNVYVVLEFTTNASFSIEKLKESYNMKLIKYGPALDNRSTLINPIIFLVLAVGRSQIIHNLTFLNDFFLNELLYRYKISLNISYLLENQGIITSQKREERALNEKKIESIFKSIDFNWERDDLIDDDRYKLGKVWSKDNYIKIMGNDYDKNRAETKIINTINDCIKSSEVKNEIKINKTIDGIRVLSKKQHEYYIKDKMTFRNSLSETEVNSRDHLKSIVQLPFIVLNAANNTGNILNVIPDIDPSSNPLQNLWYEASLQLVDNFQNFEDKTDTNGLVDEAQWDIDKEFYQEVKSRNRSKYHKVNIKIKTSDEMEFACIGLAQKKGLFNNDFVNSYKEERKKHFAWNVDTTDIHEFVHEQRNKNYRYIGINEHTELSHKLLLDSLQIHPGQPDWLLQKSEEFIKHFFRTDIGIYSNIISDIGNELILSVKQGCKPNEFILKKLLNYNIWLLIKSTSTAKHLYVSFLFDKNDVLNMNNSSCFKELKDIGKYYVTDFVSFNQSKLVNLFICESRMLSCIAFSMENYNMLPFSLDIFTDDSNDKAIRQNTEVWRDIYLMLLIQLSDKDEVEDELTRLRYIMMEGFVSYPGTPNPGKMIAKFNKRCKSRLSCFIIQKAFESINKINSGFIFLRSWETDDKLSIDKSTGWKNIFHPIFLNPLTSPGQLINYFYYGYLNNKNKTSERNVDGKLYIKILEMERKFWSLDGDVINSIGLKKMDSPDDGYHLYDSDILNYVIDKFIILGNRMFSNKFLETIEIEILTKLSYCLIEKELTTLKASSNFKEDLERHKPIGEKGRYTYHRKKVIEGTLEILNNEILVMELVPRCLSSLNSKGCLHIDIFKKNQFGGIREIYVMPIQERVCQLIIETMARAICGLFPSETMTHPESKTGLPENHTKVSNKNMHGEKCIVVGTSDDAEKWNQGHYVSKFYHMFIKLTPPYMHPFIYNTCSLWMNKKIKINQSLLDLFDHNKEFIIHNEIIQELWDIHRGKKPSNKIFRQGDSYLTIRTGMMQGILHYSSSLLHTIYQEFLRNLILYKLKQWLPEKSKKPVCTIMQSSDDSSVLLTIPVQEADQFKIMRMAYVFFIFKGVFGKYLGIYPSIKCTRMTLNLMEFNSQFFFDNSKHMPYIKSVFSSFLISEQESIQGRQEELNSLLSNIIMDGGSFSLSHIVQISQGLLHYRILGSSINKYYKTFCSEISKIPDPSVGFFLMDTIVAPGITGFRYNLWNACKYTDLGKLNKTLLYEHGKLEKLIEEGITSRTSWEVFSAGGVTRKLLLKFGDRLKWKTMIERQNISIDLLDQINDTPEILFRNAMTSEELKLKIAVKLFSPNVSKAFNTNNTILPIVSSSAYALIQPVLEPISSWFNTEDLETIPNPTPGSHTIPKTTIKIGSEYISFDYDKKTKTLTNSNLTFIKVNDNDYEVVDFFLLLTAFGSYNNNNVSKFMSEDVFECEVKPNSYIGNEIMVQNQYNKINLKVNRLKKINKLNANYFINVIKTQLKKNNIINLNYENLLCHCYSPVTLVTLLYQLSINSEESAIINIYYEKTDSFSKVFPGIHEKPIQIENNRFSLLSCIFQNNHMLSDINLSDDDFNFLFPFNKEYSELQQNILLRNDFHEHVKTYEKRKVGTKLQVFDTENLITYSPDSICSAIWFGLKNVPVSERVLTLLFKQLQTYLPWLTEDPHESLRQSPFETFIQLQNWLARNDVKRRNIKIMGAPVFSKSGKTNLLSMICNNYSSGYMLDTTRKSDFVPTQLTSDIKHVIYMLSIFPYSDIRKEADIINLLLTTDNIPFNKSFIKSRNNDLSIIQSYLKENIPSHVLSERIIKNRRGIIGGYEIPQKYSQIEKRREGIGIWKGNLFGIDIKIVMRVNSKTNLNEILCVIINKNIQSMDLIQALKEFSKEHDLTMSSPIILQSVRSMFDKTILSSSKYLYSIFNESIIVKDKGFPVFLDLDMSSFNQDINYSSLNVKLSGNNIYLTRAYSIKGKGIYRSSEHKREVRILKYHIKPSDYSSSFKETNMMLDKLSLLQQLFIKNESLDWSITLKAVDSLINETADRSIDYSSMKQFMNNCFAGSLYRKGLLDIRALLIPDPSISGSETNIIDLNLVSGLEIAEPDDISIITGDYEFKLDSSDDEGDENFIKDVINEVASIEDKKNEGWSAEIEDYYVIESDKIDDDLTAFINSTLLTFDEIQFGDYVANIDSNYSIIKQNRLLDIFLGSLLLDFSKDEIKNLIHNLEYTEDMKKANILPYISYLTNNNILKYKQKMYRIWESPEQKISGVRLW